MNNFTKFTLAGALFMSMSTSTALADGFTSHYTVDEKNYEELAEKLPPERKIALHEYLNYEQREPCQFYQPIPEGFVRDGCHLKKEVTARKMAQTPVRQMPKRTEVLRDYEVHFAFDSAAIEPAAGDILNRVAQEINQYSPREVIVAGHTDRAGPSDYNLELSQERAQAVSYALTERGVQNRVLDKKALGESRPEIETGDGVPLRENRRVVVEFRR